MIELKNVYISISESTYPSVHNLIYKSVKESNWNLVWISLCNTLLNSIKFSARDTIRDEIYD